MSKKKKVKNEIVEGFKPAFTLGAGAMGASMLGQSFQDKLPTGIVNPLTASGSVFAKFTGPVATISAAGITMKQLKKLEKKQKKR